MRSVVARVKGWLGPSDAAAIDSLAADVRALQARVDELQRHVHTIDAHQDEARARQVEDLDAIRTSIATVADDLTERIAALRRGAPA